MEGYVMKYIMQMKGILKLLFYSWKIHITEYVKQVLIKIWGF